MIGHYLVSALASIGRRAFTTAANIFTLALGLTCFLAAYGIATYWTSADSYHGDSERIAFISYSINAPGATQPTMMNQVASPAMAPYLRQDFPELAFVARANNRYDVAFAAGEQKALADVAYVDPDFTSIFDFDFVEGSAEKALADPNGVILTHEKARQLFGNGPALGRSLIVEGREDATVSGVIAPVRQPSFMGSEGAVTVRFDALRPWNKLQDAEQLERSWLALIGVTVVKLKPGASLDSFRAKLPGFLKRRLPPAQSGVASLFIDAFPIAKMRTLGLENTLSPGPGAQLSAVALILGLGLLTLLVACVNYANLATAQSTLRAKEVGMRRTLGARRGGIMVQAWIETTILSFVSFGVSLLILLLVSPWVRANMGIDPLYVWTAGPGAIASIMGIVALTAFLAGAYPAFRLSGARPADAIRAGRARSGPQIVSQILVVIQFVSASFLLIMVTVMQLQRAETEHAALASIEDPVAVLNPLAPLGLDYETLEARLLQSPAIKSVSITNLRPWGYGVQAATLARSTDPSASAPAFDYKDIGYGYFDTMNLKTIAGRVFDRSRATLPAALYSAPATQTPPLVIDRTAAERLGFASPQEAIGKIVYVPESLRKSAGLAALPVEIIGVTENETSAMETSDIAGHVYTFAPLASRGAQIPLVRFDRKDLPAAISHTRRVWDDLAPSIPLNLRFYDDLFQQRYTTYAQVGGIFMLLAGTAFLISTVGLLGIAVHTASRRRHEIAVRKTLGSSVAGVARLLLTDFSVPVLIGNLLAWPLAYLAANAYLAAFANRIDLTAAPFLASMGLTLVIAWAAVIGVVLKAASVRPAEVLRRA